MNKYTVSIIFLDTCSNGIQGAYNNWHTFLLNLHRFVHWFTSIKKKKKWERKPVPHFIDGKKNCNVKDSLFTKNLNLTTTCLLLKGMINFKYYNLHVLICTKPNQTNQCLFHTCTQFSKVVLTGV